MQDEAGPDSPTLFRPARGAATQPAAPPRPAIAKPRRSNQGQHAGRGGVCFLVSLGGCCGEVVGTPSLFHTDLKCQLRATYGVRLPRAQIPTYPSRNGLCAAHRPHLPEMPLVQQTIRYAATADGRVSYHSGTITDVIGPRYLVTWTNPTVDLPISLREDTAIEARKLADVFAAGQQVGSRAGKTARCGLQRQLQAALAAPAVQATPAVQPAPNTTRGEQPLLQPTLVCANPGARNVGDLAAAVANAVAPQPPPQPPPPTNPPCPAPAPAASPAPAAPPGVPPLRPTYAGAPPGLEQREFFCRVILPPEASGGDFHTFTLPAGWRSGSPTQEFIFAVPADIPAHRRVQVQLWLFVKPTPREMPRGRPPTLPPVHADRRRSGPGKAAVKKSEIEALAKELGVAYDPNPNPKYNPPVAWPLRPQHTFQNVTPAFYGLPERKILFRHHFGFQSWGAAEEFYNIHFSGERRDGALLAPQIQYLCALWRMRRDVSLQSLAAFFGVPHNAMGRYVKTWIKKLGTVAKNELVGLPGLDEIEELMPQAFHDLGLASVALIGDCTDIPTDRISCSFWLSSLAHSDKTDHTAAMGLQWCTPNGLVAVACDLFMGRSSEQSACKECGPIFKRVPNKWAFMYDKGVKKLQLWLPNLNRVPVNSYIGSTHTIRDACHSAVTSLSGDHTLLPREEEALLCRGGHPQPRRRVDQVRCRGRLRARQGMDLPRQQGPLVGLPRDPQLRVVVGARLQQPPGTTEAPPRWRMITLVRLCLCARVFFPFAFIGIHSLKSH